MSSTRTHVRVRIAPSPTGDPHIGTAYMALFNYCFAKKHSGEFIIRIEDTDRSRYRADSEQKLLKSLAWLGIPHDEGPDIQGPYGPYRQSERLPIYKEHVELLIQKGHAYRCFCTSERLHDLKKKNEADKVFGGYDRHCRSLSAEASAQNLAQGKPYTVRMKSPLDGHVLVKDELRGEIPFDSQQLDDQVLLKTDGFPTYHLAVVVDDHLMRITDIIRGEEWITSAPKHVLLYNMFGWPLPKYYHLPLLRNADKSKISKRKNPTSIIHFQNRGFLPAALRNFLALCGFRPKEDQEIFSTSEMIEHFTFDKFHLGGPVFDLTKLQWLNAQYLKLESTENYISHLQSAVLNQEYLFKVTELLKERVTTLDEFFSKGQFFFVGEVPLTHPGLTPKGKTASEMAKLLADWLESAEEVTDWNHVTLKEKSDHFLKENGLKPKDFFLPLRIATTGTAESPPLFETLETLGKERVRARIRAAANHLNQGNTDPTH
jgi:glutamyl-tRNA synthetase